MTLRHLLVVNITCADRIVRYAIHSNEQRKLTSDEELTGIGSQTHRRALEIIAYDANTVSKIFDIYGPRHNTKNWPRSMLRT
jgi:hypothetical protein